MKAFLASEQSRYESSYGLLAEFPRYWLPSGERKFDS